MAFYPKNGAARKWVRFAESMFFSRPLSLGAVSAVPPDALLRIPTALCRRAASELQGKRPACRRIRPKFTRRPYPTPSHASTKIIDYRLSCGNLDARRAQFRGLSGANRAQ